MKKELLLCPVNQFKNNTKMKKALTFVALASITALVACGPSAEEKAAAEKAKQDSITAVEAAKAAEEAAKAQQAADSTAKYAADQEEKSKAAADSVAAYEAAKKGGKKTTTKAPAKPTEQPAAPAPAEQPKRNRNGKAN